MRADWVDASPAMQHVRGLHAKGMSMDAMVEVSGVNRRTLLSFLNGTIRRERQDRPVTGCTPEMMRKVLAIPFRLDWTPDGFRPDLLRGLRESKGLARYSLAKAAGLCVETIQYWETGRSKPTRKKNIDAVLKLLGAEWEDVSGPVAAEPQVDAFSMTFRDGTFDPLADEILDYPCLVCGGIFRSRLMLATHPHPKKKVSA